MFFSKIIVAFTLAATAAHAAPAAAELVERSDCTWGGDYTTCVQRGESSYCLYCSNGNAGGISTCVADCNHYVQEHCTGCSS